MPSRDDGWHHEPIAWRPLLTGPPDWHAEQVGGQCLDQQTRFPVSGDG
ncbi:MAG: hypothetical protein AVDCRST_MAG33-717 [uncultured Thermomicrobiales bacterium]|uniref:Uncharacterized protein n=1 Tax=uncultured Thermomicrobiales bacterium TaxID=1645740 RepID=A0A6J4UIB6_9BACT|nr:MAG: hypothetical protein AVDCRST_MAG33-717 [uncultured Thermomicrobiales bacterium]